MSTTSPFAHYAEEVAILTEYARPIAARDRPRFFEMVDELLRGAEPGPGSVARACREVQPKFLNAPAVDQERPTPKPAKLVPRSPYGSTRPT
jgi:hypothetical protein